MNIHRRLLCVKNSNLFLVEDTQNILEIAVVGGAHDLIQLSLGGGNFLGFAIGKASGNALGHQPHAIMLGRGAVSNPMLFAQVRAALSGEAVPAIDKNRIYRFYLALCEDALTRLSGERHVLFRMKELFAYWIVLFADADSHRRRLRKANTLAEFRAAAESLFESCELYPDAGFIGNAKMNG